MAQIISLTEQPIRVTATALQALYLAVDASAYDLLDLEAVLTVEGTATNAEIRVITGMQFQTEDGWFDCPGTAFGTFSGTGVITLKGSYNGFMRYVRWKVQAMGGATAITFFIRGMGRQYL